MNPRTGIGAAVLAIALGVGTALAEPVVVNKFTTSAGPPPFGGAAGPHGKVFFMTGEGPGPMLPIVLHRANLTPEQHAKVRAILQTDHRSLHKLFEGIEEANHQLSEKLFSAGEVKLEDVAPQIDRISDARRELMEQGVKTTLAIRAVLTPEQLTKVADVKQRIDKLQAEMQDLMELEPGEPGPMLDFRIEE